MSIEKFAPSYDILKERVEKIKAALPEAFEDGKINFATLKESLGEFVEGENEETEHYAFTWPGKKQARRLAAKPPQGTLIPCKGDGVNEDTTGNVFIEGDNLEVLKLLQKSYKGKIKMIYIDPPYNTGNDFIYNDNFTQPLDEYLKLTKQIDEEGNPLVANTRTDGRFHSKWLNMMLPRLILARNLLRDDGLMFISIDDNECENLKKLCNEVFGEENFEGHIHWRRRHNQPNDPTKMIGIVAEHILAYAKDKPFYKQAGVGKIALTGDFSNPDNDPRGDWASKPWKTGSDQSGTTYKIKTPTGKIYNEEWMGEEATFKKLLDDNRIIFPNNGDGSPRKKYFKSEREAEGQCATNWWPSDQFGHNQGANSIMEDLMGRKNVFSNPKPPELIKNLMSIANCKKGDIVLDYFAGSCTTFHSAKLYDEDIKTILIQIPEPIDAENRDQATGYEFCKSHRLPTNIAEIGKERIRRTIKRIISDAGRKNLAGKDLGFKAFRLEKTHFASWRDYNGANIDELMSLFSKQENTLVDKWKEENLLLEITLQEGFPLSSTKAKVLTIKDNIVWKVSSTDCEHSIFVCLDSNIKHKTIETLTLTGKDIFICLDNAVSDEDKIRLSDKGLIKTI